MNAADYHADPAIGSTALRDLIRSPAHYHAIHVAKSAPREETPAMRRGTAVHCAVLEPERWASDYVVAPDVDRRTKAGKEAAAAFELANLDKVRITAEEHATAEAIAAAVRAHPAASVLLGAKVSVETPIAWEDDLTGTRCKGRIDLVAKINGSLWLIDLKTTRDASPAGFPREIANWMLHVQAAHYVRGWQAVHGESPAGYALIAVEPDAPHAVGVYALDDGAIDRGATMRASALDTLRECRASGKWPAYSEAIVTVGLPAWAA